MAEPPSFDLFFSLVFYIRAVDLHPQQAEGQP